MHKALIQDIQQLKPQRQICVLGSAMIDLRMNIPRLPQSGEDALLDYQNMHLGGCAFNIILALKRLAIDAYAALPLGKGLWATETARLLTHHGITSDLHNEQLDNGWCMALVEPSGERTFLTVEGAETHWTDELYQQINIPPHALIYLSGYQLLSPTGNKAIRWLQHINNPYQLIIDLGPRIEQLTHQRLQQLLEFNPLFTLNRQETNHLATLEGQQSLATQNIADFAQYWFNKYQLPLVIRADQQGAWAQDGSTTTHLAAYTVPVKDTIGAGDSHTAGVLAGLSAGWGLTQATHLGNAIASYVVAHEGADCTPTQQQLLNWLTAITSADYNKTN